MGNAVRVGAPFNPYKVFQGVFAPYWLLEHRGIGTGAKLCYIRLLGFAGKDARCYPSLETLGKSLGVSDRQARDYVKDLERAGLITSEQRGLRRTNVYLFLWTAELEKLTTAIPDDPDDTPDGPPGRKPSSGLGRNNCSAPDRNPFSVPDRNSCSGLERKKSAGPIGMNSVGIDSVESSSTSAAFNFMREGVKTKKAALREPVGDEETELLPEPTNRIAHLIMRWAKERIIRRLRSDRQVGPPERVYLMQWASILEERDVIGEEQVFSVLDVARTEADRFGQWRNWGFLTLQIQLAAERFDRARATSAQDYARPQTPIPEEPASLWAKAKARIRSQIPDIAFLNWFACTRQTVMCGSRIEVAVPDELTGACLKEEYDAVIRATLADLGISEIRFIVSEQPVEISEKAVDRSTAL